MIGNLNYHEFIMNSLTFFPIPGMNVLGYDISSLVINNDEYSKIIENVI